MYKIDAHNHPDYFWMDFDGMIKNMDQYGIAKTCLMPVEMPVDEARPECYRLHAYPLDDQTTTPFSRVINYVERAPERFILCYAPDPRRPGAYERMSSAIHTYHVKMCSEIKLRMHYDDPDAVDLFRFCGENGLAVTLHFDYPEAQISGYDYPRRHYWYGGTIDNFERLLQLCPDTNFLGHAPGFWCHISNDDLGLTNAYPKGPVIPGGKIERMLDKYPNLYCDCSAKSCFTALSRDPEYTKRLMLSHPDRFIYARDDFNNYLAEFMDTLNMPADFLEGFYHGNIEKLLPDN